MRAVHLDELEGIPVSGQNGLVWRPVRHELGIEAFGVNAYTASQPGDQVVEDHDELSGGAGHHEELYVVVSGRATFTVDGEEVDAPAGTLVFLDDPAERRSAVAVDPGTTVLAIGGALGEAFRVSPWEFSFRAAGAPTQRDARTTISEGLRNYPENGSLLYNLACYEALDGDLDAALEHLKSAIAVDEELRELAQSDADFDSIRADPRFPDP